MTKMTKQDEFLVRLKDPVYGRVHAACLEVIDKFDDVVADIDILKCPKNEGVYSVVVYATDIHILNTFNLAVKSILCDHIGYVQPHSVAMKVKDKMYSRNYYVFGNGIPDWVI